MDRKKFIKLLAAAPLSFSLMSLTDLDNLSRSFPKSERMPVVFFGHGSPMNALEENEFVQGFHEIGKSLPRPNAILCISAHWYTKGTKVTAMEMPRTIHDFGGFPQELFDVEYPAPGSPDLAKKTQLVLTPELVELDEKWGLDHGTWSVVKHLYPQADIPVVQLSIDYTKPASYHFELGRRLSALRDKGVLVMGSGNIIHNLGKVDFANMHRDNYGYDWAIEAHALFNKWLLTGDYQPLINYEYQGAAVQLAIPSPDHFLPLMYTLGMQKKGESVQLFNDKLMAGSLSMTSLKIS